MWKVLWKVYTSKQAKITNELKLHLESEKIGEHTMWQHLFLANLRLWYGGAPTHDTNSRWQHGLVQAQTFSYTGKLLSVRAMHTQSQDYCLRLLDDVSYFIQTLLYELLHKFLIRIKYGLISPIHYPDLSESLSP